MTTSTALRATPPWVQITVAAIGLVTAIVQATKR